MFRLSEEQRTHLVDVSISARDLACVASQPPNHVEQTCRSPRCWLGLKGIRDIAACRSHASYVCAKLFGFRLTRHWHDTRVKARIHGLDVLFAWCHRARRVRRPRRVVRRQRAGQALNKALSSQPCGVGYLFRARPPITLKVFGRAIGRFRSMPYKTRSDLRRESPIQLRPLLLWRSSAH
jgi:hypothetical protein